MSVEITQTELDEVARLILAANNETATSDNSENVTIQQLLSMVKAPAVAPAAQGSVDVC